MAAERGGRDGSGREEGGVAAARWLIYSAVVAAEGNRSLAKLQNTLTKTIISDSNSNSELLTWIPS
jgi:hypothetical protein